MADNKCSDRVTPASVAQAEILFGSIAVLAQTIKHFGMQMAGDGADSFDEYKAVAIMELAAQAGWLADLGNMKVGGGGHVGDAERWVLPPAYWWAVEKQGDGNV